MQLTILPNSRYVHRYAGINQCTRILENALSYKTTGVSSDEGRKHVEPSLIILSRDIRPATILSHIAIYAHLLNVPTLILPGRASVEFGSILGMKSVAAVVFLSSNNKAECREFSEEEVDANNDVDSFINYVIAHIPNK